MEKKKVKLIIVAAVALVLIIAAISVGLMVSSDRIYKGVYVGKTHLGGMTQAEAEKALAKQDEAADGVTLNFDCEGTKVSVTPENISFGKDVKKTAKLAYDAGRNKNFFKNVINIISYKLKPYTIPMSFSYDKDQLLLILKESLSDKIIDPAPMTVEIGEDKILVKNASSGKVIDQKKLFKDVDNAFEKSSDAVIDISIITETPKNLTADEFYKEYNREAKDAVYTKTEESFVIEPEVIGISIDKNDVKRILEENKNNKEVYEIPAVITMPEVTSKMLEDKYVNKIIASYSTSLGGSTANRIANVALAASKIDGFVLNPGKRFSYNDVVGPRTAATGFKSAHVYVGNQVVDGIGGGICQVSTTLYNAVIMADLKIVNRRNHSMPVGYAPLGRDATVSYGTIDFVFENDKSYPVSVKAKVEGMTLTVSIVGTSDMDYTVEFVSETVSTIPFATENVEDPTLAAGETKIISKGSNGYVANSYRVYKKDGKEYSRTFEAKSTYSSVPQKVAVGVGTGTGDGSYEPIEGNPTYIETIVSPENPENTVKPNENTMPQVPAGSEENGQPASSQMPDAPASIPPETPAVESDTDPLLIE